MAFMQRTHCWHQPNGPILLAANFARDGAHALTTIDYFHDFTWQASGLFRLGVLY
jgi:hypothetical protein